MGFYKRKPLEVEAHVFNGSSTGIGQMTKWIETGVWKESEIHTRDFRTMDVFGQQATPGDFVVKIGDDFEVMTSVEFNKLYEPLEETNRIPGNYTASGVHMGDTVWMWGKGYVVKSSKVSGEDIILTLDDGSNICLRADAEVIVSEVRA